jgi:hypothetical protein
VIHHTDTTTWYGKVCKESLRYISGKVNTKLLGFCHVGLTQTMMQQIVSRLIFPGTTRHELAELVCSDQAGGALSGFCGFADDVRKSDICDFLFPDRPRHS